MLILLPPSEGKTAPASGEPVELGSLAFGEALAGPRARLLGEPDVRGHVVESAVGAYLLARAECEGFDVRWWRDGAREVDFVVSRGDALTAIEVKSGRVKDTRGLAAFCERFPHAQPLVVGDANTPVASFLAGDVPLFR